VFAAVAALPAVSIALERKVFLGNAPAFYRPRQHPA
jgi:hypothetical protein